MTVWVLVSSGDGIIARVVGVFPSLTAAMHSMPTVDWIILDDPVACWSESHYDGRRRLWEITPHEVRS